MAIKIGTKEVKSMEPSGWQFDTSEGADFSIGIGKFVCFGMGGGSITVKQTRMMLPNAGKRYRLNYAQVTGGGGYSWAPPISFSYSTEDMPSSAVDDMPIYRLDGAPTSSGEAGPPTGFAGKYLMLTASSGALWRQYSIALLLMGSQTGAVVAPDAHSCAWKYFTLIYARNWATSIGGGVTGAGGRLFWPFDRDSVPPEPTDPIKPIPHF